MLINTYYIIPMDIKNLMPVVAIVLFIISSSLAFYFVPSMKKIPDNLNEIIYYNGKLSILNQNTLEMEHKDVEIIRKIKALKKEGDVLIIREDISVIDKKSNKELDEFKMTKIYGIDPYTASNVQGYGDLDRIGQWILPVGVKKKNYLVWNSDLDDACKKGYISKEEAAAIAYYMAEERRGGLKTYKFYGSQNNIFIGYLEDMPEAKMYYGGEIFAWVEPNTGTIVDLQKHVVQYIEFPDLHKLPSNLNVSIYLVGNMTMLNTTNAEYEFYNITLCNNVFVENVSKNYYIIRNRVIAKDDNGKEIKELCSNSKDAIDPYTMEYLKFLSDKKGLFNFPIGIKKKDYLLWNPDIKNVTLAKFIGEEEIGGLHLYKYEMKVNDYFIRNESIEGMSDRHINLYYTGTTTFWVEPFTGYVTYIKKEGSIEAVFPDLHTIPENFKGKIRMDGELWILSQPRKNIEMIREIEVKNVYWENGRKVLLIKDETNTYDKKTMEKIEIACSVEYHGIYADTAEESPNYGDMEREGIYTFPPGVEKKDYIMWNPEINKASIVYFVREEDYEDIHTYLFETKEDRIVRDDLIGMNVRYITTTKYWVEPNTGIIINMKKESVKKINPLETLTGIRGFFWIDVYKLSLSFSPDTIEEMKEKAKEMMKLIKLSNKRVKVMEINLKSKDLSKNLEKAEQQKKQIKKLSGNRIKAIELFYWTSQKSVDELVEKSKKAIFLLIFMQIIVPTFLALLGIIILVVWMRFI